MKAKITAAKERAIDYITQTSIEYGHFPIFEYYPSFEEKKHLGWHYTYPSPFLHANVMYALLNSGMGEKHELIQSNVKFLLDFKEYGDIWRFWKIDEAEHPVFCGVDDTAICSIVLEKLQYSLSNRKLLHSHILDNGSIRTWITAKEYLLKSNPLVFLLLKFRDKPVQDTMSRGWIEYLDAEPSLTANVLMFLGENERTSIVLNYLIDAWKNETPEHYMFYEKRIIFAYHLSRAYKEGVRTLGEIKDSVFDFISNSYHNFKFAELLMAFITLEYFKIERDLKVIIAKKIVEKIDSSEIYLKPYPYITAKNRVYYGGAGVLTAAWFVEFCSYLK